MLANITLSISYVKVTVLRVRKPLPFNITVSFARNIAGDAVIWAIVVAADFFSSTTTKMLLASKKNIHEMASRIGIALRGKSHFLLL